MAEEEVLESAAVVEVENEAEEMEEEELECQRWIEAEEAC